MAFWRYVHLTSKPWTLPAGSHGGQRASATHAISVALWRRPRVALAATLLPPLAWFVLLYLAALVVLFMAAFWSVDALSGDIDRTWTLDNFRLILGNADLSRHRGPHGRDRGSRDA